MLKIITDSSAEISREEAEALGGEVVPLTVVFGENAYLDGVELSKEEFYKRLLSGEFPHTSQPSEVQFSEAFARTEGEEALVLHFRHASHPRGDGGKVPRQERGGSHRDFGRVAPAPSAVCLPEHARISL